MSENNGWQWTFVFVSHFMCHEKSRNRDTQARLPYKTFYWFFFFVKTILIWCCKFTDSIKSDWLFYTCIWLPFLFVVYLFAVWFCLSATLHSLGKWPWAVLYLIVLFIWLCLVLSVCIPHVSDLELLKGATVYKCNLLLLFGWVAVAHGLILTTLDCPFFCVQILNVQLEDHQK